MAAKKVGSWRLIIVAALVLLGLLLLAGLREADAADPCARDPLFQTFCDDEPSPNASVGLAAGPGSLMITREDSMHLVSTLYCS